jgi:hypothetical protein
MATKLPQSEREELRYAVREQLVNAKTVALTADMLARRVERTRLLDFTFNVSDVEDALALIVGLGQATQVPASLGSTVYYQATAAGVLAHERGQ